MIIFVYLLGLLITGNLLAIFFETNFTAHISALVNRENHLTRDDVANWLISHELYFLGELYLCPICTGTWLAFITAVGMVAFGAPAWLIPAGMFSWPYLAHLSIKYIQNK
jgi:hypothetical protein